MKKVEYKNGTELAVKTMYGDFFDLPTRLFKATTERSKKITDLADAIELIDRYNGFEGKAVADTLRKLNDDGLVLSASFGREMSPVLCVYPRVIGDTEEERRKSYAKVKRELKKANPDELYVDEYGNVRAWWD